MQKEYELMLILKSSTPEGEAKKILESLKKSIKDSGKLTEEKNLGKKQLTYPIRRENEGSYYLLTFESDAKPFTSMIGKLRLNEFILRHLLVAREE